MVIIRATYYGAKCNFLHRGKILEVFEVENGVQEGYSLYPKLFLLVIVEVRDAALSGKPEGAQWTMTYFLKHADDICLVPHRVMNFGRMALELRREADVVGLKIPTKSRFSV